MYNDYKILTCAATFSFLVAGIILIPIAYYQNQSYQEWKKTECNITEVTHSYDNEWNIQWQVVDLEEKQHTITQQYTDSSDYLASLDSFELGNSYPCYHKTDTDWTWTMEANAGFVLMVLGIIFLCLGGVCFLIFFFIKR